MRENRNEIKKFKLVTDPKDGRKLLKMNDEFKFCPCCGKLLSEECECHKNIVVDSKPKKGAENETVLVFANLPSFQKDYEEVRQVNVKKETNEIEPLEIDLG